MRIIMLRKKGCQRLLRVSFNAIQIEATIRHHRSVNVVCCT
jgi:hypothetical protein